MRIESRYYPHPVLSPFSDDIIDSIYEVNLNVSPKDVYYHFEVSCRLTNNELLNFITDGAACFAIHIECADSRMRDIYTSHDPTFDFYIDVDKLNGKVEVSYFILAQKDIDSYHNEKFHEDYSELSFSIMRGDVLAVAEGEHFVVSKEKDDLKRIPSIFTVGKNNETGAPSYDVDLGQTNKIVIKLSKKTFEYYGQLAKSNEMAKILSSLLLLPALVTLLEQIRSSDFDYEQYEDSKWFRVIDKRLKTMGINVQEENDFTESSVVIAQKLIGEPIAGGLKDLFESLTHEKE